jgi:hypothetical protein
MSPTTTPATSGEDLYSRIERETRHRPVIQLHQPGYAPLYVIAGRFVGALHGGRIRRAEFVDIVWSAPTLIVAADSVVNA